MANEASNPKADQRAWQILRAFVNDDAARRSPEPLYAELHTLGDEFVMPDGTRIVVSHAGVSELVRSPSFI